ncbi:hypothetical protein SARC_02419 [Sphaeroforma arctica JP610]|uniref:Uncharacterized protein n=1 Tax=Sphaeroforma arctica JP610 TaxID=667725 RepID=A0A0L0G8Q1_9EUKA|nr:hypothetical protein SARC_02419 [Sphaeroforma arctica JP610]KNC85385.1 hypothetical protein SARC_02419 [Sphaeroforma arctica JP610]|eukprot:XP_014159287.1 hypothetical protein SARC_02419 [Sphaeroforma arctica JP610]
MYILPNPQDKLDAVTKVSNFLTDQVQNALNVGLQEMKQRQNLAINSLHTMKTERADVRDRIARVEKSVEELNRYFASHAERLDKVVRRMEAYMMRRRIGTSKRCLWVCVCSGVGLMYWIAAAMLAVAQSCLRMLHRLWLRMVNSSDSERIPRGKSPGHLCGQRDVVWTYNHPSGGHWAKHVVNSLRLMFNTVANFSADFLFCVGFHRLTNGLQIHRGTMEDSCRNLFATVSFFFTHALFDEGQDIDGAPDGVASQSSDSIYYPYASDYAFTLMIFMSMVAFVTITELGIHLRLVTSAVIAGEFQAGMSTLLLAIAMQGVTKIADIRNDPHVSDNAYARRSLLMMALVAKRFG